MTTTPPRPHSTFTEDTIINTYHHYQILHFPPLLQVSFWIYHSTWQQPEELQPPPEIKYLLIKICPNVKSEVHKMLYYKQALVNEKQMYTPRTKN